MTDFWDVYERSETGPFVKEADFDRQVGEVAARAVRKHGLRFDRNEVIPSDDGLADRMYQAGLELFLERASTAKIPAGSSSSAAPRWSGR